MVVFSGCFVHELVLGWEFAQNGCLLRVFCQGTTVFSLGFVVTMRDKWRWRPVGKFLNPCHYITSGVASWVWCWDVQGCEHWFFPLLEKKSTCLAVFFNKLIRAGSCSLTRSGSIYHNCGLRTHFCYCFPSLLRNRTCGRLELRLQEKVTTEGIDATDSLFMKAKPPVHGSCTLR